MIQIHQPIFRRFGALQTWIVGVQYYEGATLLAGQDVFFDREPDNPFDPNAIAAFTREGIQIGHLPRYDARYFSVLMLEGALALTGRITGPVEGGRLPLLLEVHATEKASSIMALDDRDDWRAICHNFFAAIWARLDTYSADTLVRLRDRVRELGHDEDLFPKTQFLYRMLKTVVEERGAQEQETLRQRLRDAVAGMTIGAPRGWPELAVLPLDADSGPAPQPACEPTAGGALVCVDDFPPEIIRALPTRCPYPPGSHGLAIWVRGQLHAVNWFHDTESAQVLWYPAILDAMEAARDANETTQGPLTAEHAKSAILEVLSEARFTLEAGGSPLNGKAIFRADPFVGSATFGDAGLLHLRMRIENHVVYAGKAKPLAHAQKSKAVTGKAAG